MSSYTSQARSSSYQCSCNHLLQVTDVTLLQLPALITLTRLHLCCVGASSPTLATILLAFPRLTTLILAWMPLTAAVTSTLRSMTQLNALQLLECRGVHGGDMLEAAAQLCGLTKLHVHSVEGAMGGEMEHGVATVAQHLPRLADFSCIGVYGPSMQPLLGRLASLQGLERLRLGAPTGRWASQLTALSALTALTALQVCVVCAWSRVCVCVCGCTHPWGLKFPGVERKKESDIVLFCFPGNHFSFSFLFVIHVHAYPAP